MISTILTIFIIRLFHFIQLLVMHYAIYNSKSLISYLQSSYVSIHSLLSVSNIFVLNYVLLMLFIMVAKSFQTGLCLKEHLEGLLWVKVCGGGGGGGMNYVWWGH